MNPFVSGVPGTDTYDDIVLKNYVFPNGNYQGATVGFYPGKIVGFSTNGAAIAGEYVKALAAGTMIDAASLGPSFYGSMSLGAANPNGQFNNVTDAYLGFAFPIGPTNLYYGWVRVDVNNAAGTLFIKDWAYEDQTGVGISAGAGRPVDILGDFNGDLKVDGADFLTWQRQFGTVTNQSDLVDWKANYGQSGASIPAIGVVPEPGALGLLAAGALGVAALRCRHSRS